MLGKVSDWMTKELVHVPPARSAREAIAAMEAAGVRHLLVLDGGRLAGILSARDLVRVNLTNPGRVLDLDGCTAGEIMTPAPLETTEPETPLARAAARMRDRGVDALPVLAQGELVGIISAADVLRAVAQGE
ncbi:MAG: CBS domain-containing protein [Planctomycetota bacterium]